MELEYEGFFKLGSRKNITYPLCGFILSFFCVTKILITQRGNSVFCALNKNKLKPHFWVPYLFPTPLIDTSTTHNRLLYRRFMSEHQNFKENIDIEFSGVTFVQLPFLIESPKLYKGEKRDYIELNSSYKELIPNKDKLFVIESKDSKYFIVCNRITISKNNLVGDASSLKEDNFDNISDIEKYISEIQKRIIEEKEPNNKDYLVLE